MQVEGVVTRLDGTRAFVQVRRSGGCGRCHEAGGCHGGVLNDAQGRHCQEYLVDNSCAAPAGATVAVEVPEGAALKAALLAYGVPVVALLTCAGLAQSIYESDLGTLLGGALGLVLAAAGVHGLRGGGWASVAKPRIVQILFRP